MAKINQNYKSMKKNYLFSNIAEKQKAFREANPDADIIKMGIGDVTEPLIPSVVDAIVKAGMEMGVKESFRGYIDDQGYPFLLNAIQSYYKSNSGVDISTDEIFVSDGAKSDVANFTELFSNDNTVLIPDPVYPVYMDSNLMLGRKILLTAGTEKNGFLPMPDYSVNCDIIYLCSPNNPTGAVYTKPQLKEWIEYATAKNAVILFDAAYEAFITEKELPRSIYEVPGAKSCAVEFCSLSKTAGFTGTRCSYMVVPKGLKVDGESLNAMWLRRQTTKYNGTAYVIQRAAEAVFTQEGIKQSKETISYYLGNAKIIADTLDYLGIWYTGGKNSPYIWLKCGSDSWEFFDKLLKEAHVVGTPGSGFGKAGEGYFRLTAFNTRENTAEAMRRIAEVLKK